MRLGDEHKLSLRVLYREWHQQLQCYFACWSPERRSADRFDRDGFCHSAGSEWIYAAGERLELCFAPSSAAGMHGEQIRSAEARRRFRYRAWTAIPSSARHEFQSPNVQVAPAPRRPPDGVPTGIRTSVTAVKGR